VLATSRSSAGSELHDLRMRFPRYVRISPRSAIGVATTALLVAAVSSFATSDLLWTAIAGFAGFFLGTATTVLGISRRGTASRSDQ
jgi:hypothetical protein